MHAAPAFSPPQVCPSTGYPAITAASPAAVGSAVITAASPAAIGSAVGRFPGATLDREDLPCRVQDPDLWFAERPADLETAKSFCADCPIRNACLTGALDRREPWGVWGGEIFDHGVVIARKRPRGRPRKEVAA